MHNIKTFTIKSNEEKTILFQRSPHDREHPFVMINKFMFRDKNLTIETKGFLGYLLTLPDTWKINQKHLCETLGFGKEKFYRMLNELIKFGYCEKVKVKDESGRYMSLQYSFSEEPRFKKEVPRPEKPDTEKQELGKQELGKHETYRIHNIESKEENSIAPIGGERSSSKADLIPPEALEIAQALLNKILLMNPKHKLPKLDVWAKTIDLMMRIDKRTKEEILEILDWIFNDPFWKTAVLSPDKLRKHYDTILLKKINAKPKDLEENLKKKAIDKANFNAAWAKKLYKDLESRYPELNNFLQVASNCVYLKQQGKFSPLGYAENGFQDQLTSFLRKNGIK
jgi:Txe/YoeB family toxin of Txe-Axe toxin-antitoxin module